ncbi:MAG: glycosyltransferase family 2 protein [Verrucomicrobiae bacterium]
MKAEKKLSITLFIPVMNEIHGLREIMPRINREWVDEILIIDGGSTDGSKDFLRSLGYAVVGQKKKGVKAAFWEAFEIATGDVIVPFSPDGNSIPEDIPKLIDKINEGYDIVIASRYLETAKSRDDDLMSAIANRFLTCLINLCFGAKLTDAMGMFKAFKKQHLYLLEIDKHKNEHSEVMLPARGSRFGLRIIEIPSEEPPRIGPQGSHAHPGLLGKYKSGVLILMTILRDAMFYWNRQQNA